MVSRSRRQILCGAAALAGSVAGCSRPRGGSTGSSAGGTERTTSRSGNRTSPDPSGDVGPLRLEPIAEGLDAPVGLEVAPDDADRRYVLEQPGRITVVDGDGRRSTPFLDLTDRIRTGGERGLLGLAFHPSFASNGRCYVRYSAPPRDGTPDGYSHTFVLAEFESRDGLTADPGSERAVLEIPEPQSNHNAGAIAFGPDGYLYVAVGDGGAGNDEGTGHVEGGNGQDVVENLLGSMLRIDVDDRSGDRPYGIPPDNPLVDRPGLDEHFAWGLRNPWRMSFDGDRLIVGDVGQNRFEEVDIVERGGNYGWNIKEGTECFRAGSCPEVGPRGERLRPPVAAYPHAGEPVSGISIIGGYVYRGSAVPGLTGRYVFGDLAANGRLFVADPVDGRPWPTGVLELVSEDRRLLSRLFSFGRDRHGELYALGEGSGGGAAYRLAPALS